MLGAVAPFARRDHSVIACSRYMYNGVVLHAHPVRGESHNERNTTGEVATPDKCPLKLSTENESDSFSSAVRERKRNFITLANAQYEKVELKRH